ncbi:hypothetical protein M3G04_02435 [Dietzia cinnamea]|uniref:hypothetical protein n=1 Tax=Dietzia cinnamea TaxID=321318 RepID=UPI00223B15C7|nr:hypothetical protein [Dietzia cinnamea]MCT2299768.1 hypothetical protein [Dietzia cinnamea]
MTTIETATGCRITVGPKGLALWDRSAHLIGYELSTPLTADERRALVAALNPGQGGQWTRYDFARLDIHPLSPAGEVIDEVVAWLNAHHPKPQPYDQGGVRGADSLLYRAERERDAAVRTCDEQAEQLIPAYAMLDIWMALGRDSIHFDDWYDEHGYADAWAELTAAVREARTAPAVSRAEPSLDAEDCDACTEVQDLCHFHRGVAEGVGMVAEKLAAIATDPDLLALIPARAIEAEAVVDPVEAKARELYEHVYAGPFEDGSSGVQAEYRKLAAHVLGQEASSDE